MASLTCGLVGLTGLCFAPLGIVGLVGLGLGIAALVSINGQPQRLTGKGLAIAGICTGTVSMLGMCIGLALFLPALAGAQAAARQVAGATSMRQIGMAMGMYAQANGGWMPETADGWEARLQGKYLSNPEAFNSPQIEGNGGGELIYVPPSGPLSGLADASTIIVVYEDPTRLRWDRVNVLYADGRVEMVKKAELEAQLARQRK